MNENIELLAHLINDQQIIVFAGPDLINVSLLPEESEVLGLSDPEPQMKLMDYLTFRLLQNNSLPIHEKFNAEKQSFDLNQTLHDILINDPGAFRFKKPQQIVRDELKRIFEENNDRIDTRALSKLAQITPIKLFFNTSGINILRHYIGVYREQCSFYNFFSGNRHEDVLPDESDYDMLDHTVLYNLFGSVESYFCLTEMDYVDFIFKYHENRRKLQNLKNLIDNRNDEKIYLFLGCNLPNWLFRFFIRAFTERSIRSIGSNIIFNEYPMDQSNSVYFNRNAIKYMHEISPVKLVDEIYDAIQQLYPDSISSEITEKLVFISYASEDKKRVEFIYQQLSNAGVDVWFDVQGGIQSGEKFRDKIIEGIDRTSIFLPIISQKSAQGSSDRHYRKEWDYANGKASNGELEIIPIWLDEEVENGNYGIPEWIWQRSIARTNDDCLLEDRVVNDIRKKQENYRYAQA